MYPERSKGLSITLSFDNVIDKFGMAPLVTTITLAYALNTNFDEFHFVNYLQYKILFFNVTKCHLAALSSKFKNNFNSKLSNAIKGVTSSGNVLKGPKAFQ